MNWPRSLEGRLRFEEPLKNYTTFKIGGPAQFFAVPKDTADLKSLIRLAKKDKIPLLILGAGSNLLVSDKGLKAMVVSLKSAHFKKISFQANLLKAGSGVRLSQLVSRAEENSLGGLEFLAGIPGTLGGALAMNAGAWGKSMADVVEEVRVMDYNGRTETLSREKIKFRYRSSILDKFIILSACLRLVRKSRQEIEDQTKKLLSQRSAFGGLKLPNAGCIFKNPNGVSAGRLIDLCGLKGRKVGRACVSGRHANFILNRGNARFGEVMELISLIKRRVKNKFNIALEPEIKIWE